MKARRHIVDLALCLILLAGATWLRVNYLGSLTKDPNSLNFGGDPGHHYNIAWNIAHGRGPVTDFIFSYWFRHPQLPALTDIYPPGVHIFLAAAMMMFGDGYAVARFVCLFFGVIGGALVYFLARQFLGRALAFAAAAILVLNPVHLEHSTVVMTPVVASFFVWLTMFALLLFRGAYFRKGALAGWAHLCISTLPSFGLALFLSEAISKFVERSPLVSHVRRLAFFVAGAALVIAPWAIWTYRYFGKPLYSNLNFYPITHSWVPMNYDTTPPVAAAFIQASGGILGVAQLYGGEIIRAFRDAYLQSLPLACSSDPVFTTFTALNLLLLVAGVVRIFQISAPRAALFLSFFVSYLTISAIGGTGLGGRLFTRHFTVFVPFLAIIWALGVDLLALGVRRVLPRVARPAQGYMPQMQSAALCIVVGLFAFESWSWPRNFVSWKRINSDIHAFQGFWNRQVPELEEAARWIHANTPEDAVFMYGSTPQDFWAVTRRSVVIDPVYAGPNPNRAREEAEYYGVDYLVLDSNQTIYPRQPLPADVSRSYPGMDLTLAWKNAAGTFLIYKIDKLH